jgi:hypothetical protein
VGPQGAPGRGRDDPPYEDAHWRAINQGVDPGAHVQGAPTQGAIQEDDLDEDP